MSTLENSTLTPLPCSNPNGGLTPSSSPPGSSSVPSASDSRGLPRSSASDASVASRRKISTCIAASTASIFHSAASSASAGTRSLAPASPSSPLTDSILPPEPARGVRPARCTLPSSYPASLSADTSAAVLSRPSATDSTNVAARSNLLRRESVRTLLAAPRSSWSTEGRRGGIAGVGSCADFGKVQCTVDSFTAGALHAGSTLSPGNFAPRGEPSELERRELPGPSRLFVFGADSPCTADPPPLFSAICASFAARHDIIRPSPRSHAADDSAAVADGRVSGLGTSMCFTSRPKREGVPVNKHDVSTIAHAKIKRNSPRGKRSTSPAKIAFQSFAILCGAGTPVSKTMRVTATDHTSALAPYSLPETTSGAE